MSTSRQSRDHDADAANPGAFRPPVVYSLAILAGAGLGLYRPLPWLPAAIGPWAGIPLVAVAAALFVASIRKFKAAGTPVPGNVPTVAIVRSGPYRFSRNPIYLAFSMVVLGIACSSNNLWLLGLLAVAASVMNFVVIPREERYLERRFGAGYLDYKAKVRRWL